MRKLAWERLQMFEHMVKNVSIEGAPLPAR